MTPRSESSGSAPPCSSDTPQGRFADNEEVHPAAGASAELVDCTRAVLGDEWLNPSREEQLQLCDGEPICLGPEECPRPILSFPVECGYNLIQVSVGVWPTAGDMDRVD